jgi:drug/metabolite transporter (DMT)-like permease
VRSATRLEGSWISVAAGTALAVDLIAWHHCIVAAGAGLGTVIGQSQIIFVVAFSALFARERIQQVSRGGIALMVVGIVCISGLLQHSAFGSSPLLGVAYGLLSGATYALFIVLLRMAHRDANRPVAPLLTATSVAAVGALVLAALLGEMEWPASLAAHGWLAALALSSQVLGWLFISVSIAALPALTTSLILSLQPACALVFAAAILAERPSALQLLGALLVAAGFVAVVGKSPNEKRQQ